MQLKFAFAMLLVPHEISNHLTKCECFMMNWDGHDKGCQQEQLVSPLPSVIVAEEEDRLARKFA